ncbi:MAG: hypothetical protein EOO14_19600 [Chitinophagaceae bacterium]|nr:MAG: hypothetical protein EOO14_19600 [Chitinophagaceae bacterium]
MRTFCLRTAAFLFLFTFVLSLHQDAQAQTASRQAFEKAIITDLCDTFTKAAHTITKENMNLELGMMLLPLFTKYEDEIKKEWGLSAGDEAGAQAIGEKIGQLAVVNCTPFHDFIKANLVEKENEKAEGGTKSFSGTLTKIEGTPFTYLLVRNAQGKTDRFYWMEFFPGAEKLSASAATILNKPVRVSYREMEVYKAAEKDYNVIKVITDVTFK